MTTPIPSMKLAHLQQQRPLFSPKHRRRSSIKKFWSKEKLCDGIEQYKVRKGLASAKKTKAIATVQKPPTGGDRPALSHIDIVNDLKVRVDDVIIVLMSQGSYRPDDREESKLSLVKAVNQLVNALEYILRDGMKERKDGRQSTFTDDIVKMTLAPTSVDEEAAVPKGGAANGNDIDEGDDDEEEQEQEQEEGRDSIEDEDEDDDDEDDDDDDDVEDEDFCDDDDIEDIEEEGDVQDDEEEAEIAKILKMAGGSEDFEKDNSGFYYKKSQRRDSRYSLHIESDYFGSKVSMPNEDPNGAQFQSEQRPPAAPITPAEADAVSGKALIAAWLQTGSAYEVMKLIVKGDDAQKMSVYRPEAALLNEQTASDVLRILKRLNEVEIKINTAAVLGLGGSTSSNFSMDQDFLNNTPTRGQLGRQSTAISTLKKTSRKKRRSVSDGNFKGNFVKNLFVEAKDMGKKVNPFKRRSEKGRQKSWADSDSSVSAPSEPFSVPEIGVNLPVRFNYHRNAKTVERLREARRRGLEAWVKKIEVNSEEIMERSARPMASIGHAFAYSLLQNSVKIGDEVEVEKQVCTFSAVQVCAAGPCRSLDIPGHESTLLFGMRPKRIRPKAHGTTGADKFYSFCATYSESSQGVRVSFKRAHSSKSEG